MDAQADDLYTLLMDQFQAYTADAAQLAELIGSQQSDKEGALERLGDLAAAVSDLLERMARLREALAAAA